MTIADRQELQRRRTVAGFDTGAADGVIGGRTRDALSGYQAREGLAVSGEASLESLEGLR